MPSPRQDRTQAPSSRREFSWARLATIGGELGGTLIGFTLLGYWLDRHYGTSPKALVVCIIIGLVGGFYNFIRAVRQVQGSASPDPPERTDG